MHSPCSTFVFQNLGSTTSHDGDQVLKTSETYNEGLERFSEAHVFDRLPFLGQRRTQWAHPVRSPSKCLKQERFVLKTM